MKTFKIYLGKHPLINAPKPIFLGQYEADTFRAACQLWASSKKSQQPEHLPDLYSAKDNTWWGSNLYQSEADAMIEFESPEIEIMKNISKAFISAAQSCRYAGGNFIYDQLADKTIEILKPYRIIEQKELWQPIATAPEDNTKILAWDGECMHVVKRNLHASRSDWPYLILKDSVNAAIEACYDGDCSYAEMNPTHWMPLPEPPKQ